MKVCEFLLQKEGDRVWLPLEPPTVEILEGRYRIVARTQQPQTEVLVEVSYWSPEEMPPKRRTRHWTRHTNAKGIMPVLPFTDLRSGNWRVQCSSNLLMDMGENGWQHVVELRVLAQEEGFENWQPDPNPLEPNSPDTAPSTSPPTLPLRSPDPLRSFGEAALSETEHPRTEDPRTAALSAESLQSESLQSESTIPPATPSQPRRVTVEELRSLAEQMSQLVMDTVLEVGEMSPAPAVASAEDQETQDFFTVPEPSTIPVAQFTPTVPDPLTASAETIAPETIAPETIAPKTTEDEQSNFDTFLPEGPITEPPDRETVSVPVEILSGLQLRLEKNTIVPSAYNLFEIYCYILTANGTPLQESSLPLQARVMLQNPSNMEVRLAMTHLLATQPLNQPFYLSGHIALDWRNQLLLGEVQLQSLSLSVEDLTEAVVTIATAPFTIMPPVDALLTQVNPPEPSSTVPEPSPEPEPPQEQPRKPQIRADFLEVTRRSLSSLIAAQESPGELTSSPSPSPSPPLSPKVAMPPNLKDSARQASGQESPRPSPNLPTFVQPFPAEPVPPEPVPPEIPSEPSGTGASAPDLLDPFLDPFLDPLDRDATGDPLAIEPSVARSDALGSDVLGADASAIESTAISFSLEPSGFDSIGIDPSGADPSEADSPEQLTLLNLSEWTDPSITPTTSEDTERISAGPPRKVIELPPIPSRSSALIPDPLSPELSAAELAAFATPGAIWAESPIEPESLIEPQAPIEPQAKIGAIVKTLESLESVGSYVESYGKSYEGALGSGDSAFLEGDDLDLEAENEILLGLFEGDSDRFPSVLTNVLQSDPSNPSLHLAPVLEHPALDTPAEAQTVQGIDRPLAGELESTEFEITPLETVEPPQTQSGSDTISHPVSDHTAPATPTAPTAHNVSEEVSREVSAETPSSTRQDDPLLLWTDEPTVDWNPESTTDTGNFFSQEDVSPVNPRPSDPVLESFFTEPPLPAPTPIPEPLSFATEAESLEQVQVPPHLRLSEIEPGDLPMAESVANPLLRPTEPFVPDHLRQEIVVDDEWLEPDTRYWMALAASETIVTWPEDEPLPVPVLDIPAGDLVGGEGIRVTLRLPETPSRLVVKIWLIDCQTRSLAAGPFWAYQFLPTLPTFREAIVEIPIPLGCLEVQFEALTIESETQRESHKTTVVKTIVPANTPQLEEPTENLLEMDNLLEYLPPTLALEPLETLVQEEKDLF